MQQQSLVMVVTNTHQVESGVSPKMQWRDKGGTIGSGFSDEWVLRDRNNKVKSAHCEVVIVDGAFCIKDNCGETYVNGSSMPLGKLGMAKLTDLDELQIGPYHIRVEMNGENAVTHVTQDLGELMFTEKKGLLDQGDDEHDRLLMVSEADAQWISDPLAALDEAKITAKEEISLIDPEVASEEENDNDTLFFETLEKQNLSRTYESNSENQMTSSINLKRILGLGGFNHHKKDDGAESGTQPTLSQNENNNIDSHENWQAEGDGMDENVLDLLEEEVAKSMAPASNQAPHKIEGGSGHLLTGPMLRGMGVESLSTDDMVAMQMLSEELGASLRSCIEGLLDLHEQVCNGHFGVMNRNLQPIEDNPLRLGLGYEETIKTMYDAEKSMVHLSAPAAIAESLKNIRDHNDAVQQATSQALQQILAAFSPEVLLRRFNHYKRASDTNEASDDRWAWNMYCSYYKELTSSRQKGFEKLFWEIFEQAYDKKIREKQLEF